MARFVLLDRDGVINCRVRNGYVRTWEQFVFLPNALEALRLFAENDYRAIVVSNQACVGKGLISLSTLEEITRRFVEEVRKYGGQIHGVYYCPHRQEENCDCRKPKPGLLQRAQREHQFAFADTYLVGDSESDLLAAREVGCPVLLISDDVAHAAQKPSSWSGAVFPSLHEAARFIIEGATAPQ